MSDIKLFKSDKSKASEVKAIPTDLERDIQKLIEQNLDTFFNIRFIATEYGTGKKHKGRIDSLGIDENNSPVIIEYKRHKNENVINQGLFYLDWLLDHKAEFEKISHQVLGSEVEVDWSAPRLLCIAGDFTKYDEYAIEQINRNIELIRFRRFEGNLVLFELATSSKGETIKPEKVEKESKTKEKILKERMKTMNADMVTLFEAIDDFILALGDDVQKKELRYYFAYSRFRNFACVELYNKKVQIYLKLDPSKFDNLPTSARDVREIGHRGTGDLEMQIASIEEFHSIKSYIEEAYNIS